MQPFEQIKEYCNQVNEQIRWKKAKPMIAAEIENHLCDQRDAYISSGDNETAATQKAILQMGDAVFVGQELDKAHRPKPQWFMIALTGFLMLIGLSVNYLISATTHSLHSFSILPVAFAFGLFICCYYMDFTRLGKHSKKIYAFILIVSVIGILRSTGVNGRLTWLVGRYSVALSYLSLVFPLVFALFVYSMRNKGLCGILLCGVAYFPLAAILLVIPSISGLILYTISSLSVLCFFICRGGFGVSKRQGLLLVLLPTITAFIGLAIALVFAQYGASRFSVFLNPEQARLGAGYLYCLIRDILSGSVFLGKGSIPHNMEVISALPNIETDYSLVYLIHRFGFVVLCCLAIIMAIFSVIGVRKALKEKSMLGALVAVSIMLTFMLQTAFYIVDNLGYGLVSSLSLPFISYGNTALLINSALIGFMLSVFRTGEIVRDHTFGNIADKDKDHNPIFAYEDGKLIINLNVNRSLNN